MRAHSHQVIATTSAQEKIDWLNSINNGPTKVANYKTQNFTSVVKEATNNKGVDIIVDFVGQTHWNQNLDSLAIDGTMVCLAVLSGETTFHVRCGSRTQRPTGTTVPSANIAPILSKRLRIQGSTLRSRSQEYQADLIKK